ncbi:MAG: MFS transporter [Candidatus Obscuribacterales bacterium]|nr:MFS transporter [Candidatus Obscuribacterales bacterium]
MVPSTDQNSVLDKISLRLMPFLMVLYIISYLDRINLSYAGLEMNDDLGLSPAAFGFGAGIFFVGYCVFGVPANIALRKIGARRWISLLMIAWGLVTVSFPLVANEGQFYVLRFLLGVFEAGFFPGILYYLTRFYSARAYGGAVAKFMTAIPVAGLLGSLVAFGALGMGGVAGMAGWKWLFIITGVPSVLLGAAVYFVLPDSPKEAQWMTQDEKDTLAALIKTESGTENAPDQATSSSPNAIKQFLTWHLAVLYFALSLIMYGYQLWLPQLIKADGNSSNSAIALLSAIPALFQGLGMVLIARSSDRRQERTLHMVVSAGIITLGFLASALIPDNHLKIAALSITAFGIWGTVGPFWAAARAALPAQTQATGIAFINSIGALGGFAGPYFIGVIKSIKGGGFADCLLVMAAMGVVVALLAVSIKSGRSR